MDTEQLLNKLENRKKEEFEKMCKTTEELEFGLRVGVVKGLQISIAIIKNNTQ